MKKLKGIFAAFALVAVIMPCVAPNPASADVMPEPEEMAGCTYNWQCNQYCYPDPGMCIMQKCYCY